MHFFLHILHQSLLFLPLSLGLFLSYRILRCTDLTVDGSFVLGAAAFAKAVSIGASSLVGQIAAVGAGLSIGLIVSLIHIRVQPLLAGILMLFILHSFNLHVMGRPNISLLGIERLPCDTLALSILGLALIVAFIALLKSRIGLLLRAFGNNPKLIQQQGFSTVGLRALGLMLSNGCVAACGALTAQVNGYADIQMGFGIVLIGIGTVVLGQHIVAHFAVCQRFTPLWEVLGCLAGVLTYFTAVHVFLALGVNLLYVKMLIGLSLMGFMVFTRVHHA